MEDINYNFKAYEKGFNQGYEMLKLAPDIYESIMHITNAPKEYIEGLRDSRKEYEKSLEQSEVNKNVDRGLER